MHTSLSICFQVWGTHAGKLQLMNHWYSLHCKEMKRHELDVPWSTLFSLIKTQLHQMLQLMWGSQTKSEQSDRLQEKHNRPVPTVMELDATDFVLLKYDFTHVTVSGKPKKEQVYLALRFHCPSSGSCDDARVWVFFNPPNQKFLLLKAMLGVSPTLHRPGCGYRDA